MSEKFDRKETEAKINMRSWRDPAFKERAQVGPTRALKEFNESFLLELDVFFGTGGL